MCTVSCVMCILLLSTDCSIRVFSYVNITFTVQLVDYVS